MNQNNVFEVATKKELKAALKSDADEIVIRDEELVKHIRMTRKIKRYGPAAVAAVVTAVVAAVPTGGVSIAALGVTAAATTGVSVTALYAALGATVLIAVLTEWDEIELPVGIKLKRKSKSD